MPAQESSPLDEWRQGDFTLAELDLPRLSVDEDGLVIDFVSDIVGVAVLSQSCDIARSADERPNVHVAAIIPATAEELELARKGRSVRYLYLAPLASDSLVIDLEVVATVNKNVVEGWVRKAGCASDEERRNFAAALARHRARPAFPDDFHPNLSAVKKWLYKKKGKASAGGRLFNAIEEIRVACDDWDAPGMLQFDVYVSALPEDGDVAEWNGILRSLEEKASGNGYPDPSFRYVTYDDVSAREYLEAEHLDFDSLSDSE